VRRRERETLQVSEDATWPVKTNIDMLNLSRRFSILQERLT